ncbi:hypothetical protein ACC755_37585, partial [Rhizobium ruizarguesonis]
MKAQALPIMFSGSNVPAVARLARPASRRGDCRQEKSPMSAKNISLNGKLAATCAALILIFIACSASSIWWTSSSDFACSA